MLRTARSFNGAVVAPHRLASESGVAVLRRGGNAVETAIAAAATLCVVYPHMTGLGGDTFWLILPAGASTALASRGWYAERGCTDLPVRGPLACVTCAEAAAGWQAALKEAAAWPHGVRDIGVLLSDAVRYAREGFAVSHLQSAMTKAALRDLRAVPGFAAQFLDGGKIPEPGSRMRLPALARTLERLCEDGPDGFYRVAPASDIARDLEDAGTPLRLCDLEAHKAETGNPLRLMGVDVVLCSTPPPTQGVASLMILGIFERYVRHCGPDLSRKHELVHAIVEATKQAFQVRDDCLADPTSMPCSPESLLDMGLLDELAQRIDPVKALP